MKHLPRSFAAGAHRHRRDRLGRGRRRPSPCRVSPSPTTDTIGVPSAPPANPTSANQIQNIDQVKTAIKAYYGDTPTTAVRSRSDHDRR